MTACAKPAARATRFLGHAVKQLTDFQHAKFTRASLTLPRKRLQSRNAAYTEVIEGNAVGQFFTSNPQRKATWTVQQKLELTKWNFLEMLSWKAREIMRNLALVATNPMKIELTGRDLDEDSLETLLHRVRTKHRVKALSLREIGIQRKSIWSMMKVLMQNTALKYLHLSDGNLTVEWMEDLLIASGTQRTLAAIVLRNGRLDMSNEEMKRMAALFGHPWILQHFKNYKIYANGVMAEMYSGTVV